MANRDELTTVLAVAAGGILGATARWAVSTLLVSSASDGFPWPTFVVNVVGCFAIGLASMRVRRDTAAWAFLATGVLGGFTTMSSFAVELKDLADDSGNGTAALYLGLTLAAGLGSLLGAERLAGSGHTVPADADDPEGIE